MMPKFFLRIDAIDKKIMLAIEALRINWLILILRIFTESARGYSWAIYVITLNILIVMNIDLFFRQDDIRKALFCPLFAWGFGKIIKAIVKRKRPFQGIENFSALTHSPINDSFPSLHAASTTSFFAGLFICHHPLAPIVGVWALIVSFSRLYLGVHYLTDLLGGMLIGVLGGSLIFLMN